MKYLMGVLALVGLLMGAPARAQDETLGSTQVVTVLTPQSCGFAATNSMVCGNIPISGGGYMSLTAVPRAYVPYGYVVFNGLMDINPAIVQLTKMTFTSTTTVPLHCFATLHVEFNGTTGDDGGTFTGVADFTFTYHYSSGGGGRGGGGAGWRQWIQSGVIGITYN
jgi:hypothetical protein